MRNPRQNALIHHTITPTVLVGSAKTNVIPREATAQLDCRLLPGESPDEFLALLGRVIDDVNVVVEPLLSFLLGLASGLRPRPGHPPARRDPLRLGPVIPSIIPGFTDAHYFRERGIASYGFVPFVLDETDARTVHGIDERVSLENLRRGPELLVALLRSLSWSAVLPPPVSQKS